MSIITRRARGFQHKTTKKVVSVVYLLDGDKNDEFKFITFPSDMKEKIKRIREIPEEYDWDFENPGAMSAWWIELEVNGMLEMDDTDYNVISIEIELK